MTTEQPAGYASGSWHGWALALSTERQAALHLEAGAALACAQDYVAALNHLQTALSLTTHGPRHANTLYWLGHCATAQRDLAAAAGYYALAVQALMTGRPTRGRVLTLCKLGHVLTELRRYPAARQHLEQAANEARLLGTGLLRLLSLSVLGHLAVNEGQLAEAHRLANEAGGLGIQDSEGRSELTHLLGRLSELSEDLGEHSSGEYSSAGTSQA